MLLKWIVILFLFLLVGSVQALNYNEATIRLSGDDNGTAVFSMYYSLSEGEQLLAKIASEEVLNEGRTLFGLEDDKSGMFNFSTSSATRWEESSGSRVLVFNGYDFQRLDWSLDTPPVNNEMMDKIYMSSIRLLIEPDLEPDKITVIWPDNEENSYENVSVVPNLTRTISPP